MSTWRKRIDVDSRDVLSMNYVECFFASSSANKNLYLRLPAGNSVWWDDSRSIVEIAGNDSANSLCSSTYPYGNRNRVRFYGDLNTVTRMYVASNSFWCNVKFLARLPNLTILNIHTCPNFVGSIDDIGSNFSSLVDLDFSVTGAIGYINNLPNNAGMDRLVSAYTSVSANTDATPAWDGVDLFFNDNGWSSTEVDNCLNAMYAGGVENSDIRINGNNAVRTAASNTAYTWLDANNTQVLVTT